MPGKKEIQIIEFSLSSLRNQFLQNLPGVVGGFPCQGEDVRVILRSTGQHELKMTQGFLGVSLQQIEIGEGPLIGGDSWGQQIDAASANLGLIAPALKLQSSRQI